MLLLRPLEKAINRQQMSRATQVAIWVLTIIVPTVLRWAMAPLVGDTVRYATYFPATLVAALLLGGRAGMAAMLACALVANYLFVPPVFAIDLSETNLVGALVFMFTAGLIVVSGALLRRALIHLRRASEREAALNRELQHRVKNTLAVVTGLAYQVAKNPASEDFYPRFAERLKALSRAHDLLAQSDWRECDLLALVEGAVEPFKGGRLIHVAGPTATLQPETCVPLVLCLHELATNAMKHGSLSVQAGRVALTWTLSPLGASANVHLRWQEFDGPPVAQPTRRGLGSRLLIAQQGIDGVWVHYAPEGLVCEIVIPSVPQARPGLRSSATQKVRQPAHA